MSLRSTYLGLLAGMALAAAVSQAAFTADEGGVNGTKTMHDGTQASACGSCHSTEKDRRKITNPSLCCDANCMRCHKEMDRHHPVGADVKEKDKVSLPLLGGNRVGCISCHDVKMPATDGKCWKSESLYARLFQHQTTYKTYYLRINNANGNLCKTCH